MASDYPFGIFHAVLFCLYVTSYLVEVGFNKQYINHSWCTWSIYSV